ncbi:uncharacterized protein BXZ73DRAFT_107637 [Epithele typhae]|uniref:uncharacterized protein n=1 Tax=Epithele typhae TaxID=378194 RepID=UPI0020085B20|nr:uncharacterized protein BXZ73DRAFT_107637 [Epithele typhae]KAH9912091.1 hypothetical protein BXZ73DRAFT_107637 [Epithele typhae]
MFCCSTSTREEKIDTALAGAKTALGVVQGVLKVVLTPYVAEGVNVLITIVEKVEAPLRHELIAIISSTKKGLKELAIELGTLANILKKEYEQIQKRTVDVSGREQLQDLGESVKDRTLPQLPVVSARDAQTLKDMQTKVLHIIRFFQAMDQLIERMRQQRRDDVLEKLPRADAGYRASTNNAKSKFLPGTRQELFKQLSQWVRGEGADVEGRFICHLSGVAGAGKSTIAREFAKCQDDDHGLAASFFFARDIADCSFSSRPSLIKSRDLKETSAPSSSTPRGSRGQSQQMQFEADALLTKPLSLVDPSHRRIVFVVDALDECVEPVDRDLPSLLVELFVGGARRARFPVKILFTSRPLDAFEAAIYASIDSLQDKIYSLDLSKQSPASVLEDVKLFLGDRLANSVPGYDTLRNRGDLVDRLAERSEGLMVYADTAVKFLAEYPEDVEDRAEYLLSNPKRCELLGPLNDLYLKVLEIAFPRHSMEIEEPLRDRVQTMLGTIALLKDRFSPNDLEKLLSTPTETSVSVLRHLRSVVFFNLNDLDAAFRPIHITFSQFLVDVHPKYDKGPYLVKTVREHGHIAVGCLDTLVSSLHQNPLHLASGTARSGVAEVEKRVSAEVPKHVRYACLHWAGHLAQSDQDSKDVYAALEKFAKSAVLQWVETMAQMGRMDAVTVSLNRAVAWQKVGPARIVLKSVHVWLGKHSEMVKDDPEAIYRWDDRRVEASVVQETVRETQSHCLATINQDMDAALQLQAVRRVKTVVEDTVQETTSGSSMVGSATSSTTSARAGSSGSGSGPGAVSGSTAATTSSSGAPTESGAGAATSGEEPVPEPEPVVVESETPDPEAPIGEGAPAPAPAPKPEAMVEAASEPELIVKATLEPEPCVQMAAAAAEPSALEAVPDPIFEVAVPEPEILVEETPAPEPEPVVEETPASDPAVIEAAPEHNLGPVVVEAASNFEPAPPPAIEAIPETESVDMKMCWRHCHALLRDMRVTSRTHKEGFSPRQDVVAELSRWATVQKADVSTQTICVLTGAPGVGKSTIAAEFAQRLGHRLGASFFFARGIADTSSTRLFFRTIAYELAHSQGDLHDVFVQAVRDHIHDVDDLLPQDTGKILFRDPLLLAEPRDDDPVFLVIDGLDECIDAHKTGPSKMIESLVSSVRLQAPSLKIFFTSSPGDVIDTTVIANVNLVDTIHIVDLNQQPLESVDRDLKLLLRHHLSNVVSEPLLDRLARWADRNFLCADVAARFLVENITDVNRRAEYILSTSEPSGALGPLDDFYLKILEAAYPRDVLHADTQTCEDVQAVLGGLALLRDALSPNTLQTLLGPTIKKPASVLLRLSTVVDCNPNDLDAPARALHASFARFLVARPPRHDKGPYLVDTRREHARLAVACLRALLTLARGPVSPPHVRYACVHWAAHLAQSDQTRELFGLVASFVRGALLRWVETIAEMRRLDVVDEALEKASAWQEGGKTRRSLADVRKWVGEYRDVVKVRPSAVYECGIPLVIWTLFFFGN